MILFTHIVGWVGAFLVVLAYLLVSSKKVQGDSRAYQFMNLAGAVGVGINALYQAAWPSFAIQIVWGMIALVALIQAWRRRYLQHETTRPKRAKKIEK